MTKRIACLLTALLVLCMGATAAWAHPVPDLTAAGSITVELHSGEKKLEGGTLTFRRVGEIIDNDGDFSFVPTEEVQPWGSEFGEISSPDTAKSLLEFAEKLDLAGLTVPVRDGKAVCEISAGELGLYLVSQSESSDGYYPVDPFLISVPNLVDGDYCYQVNATPKVGTLTELPPPPPPEPAPEPELPDTGQLNWPVAVLAALGVLLLAAGTLLKVQDKRVH